MDVWDPTPDAQTLGCLILAAGPDHPGAREALELALAMRSGASPLPVMLTADGLFWADTDALQVAERRGKASVSLCTLAARAQGWTPEKAPDWIQWSGIAIWMLRHAQAPWCWTVMP